MPHQPQPQLIRTSSTTTHSHSYLISHKLLHTPSITAIMQSYTPGPPLSLTEPGSAGWQTEAARHLHLSDVHGGCHLEPTFTQSTDKMRMAHMRSDIYLYVCNLPMLLSQFLFSIYSRHFFCQFRSCGKVKVDILGSLSLVVSTVSVDVKQY